MTTKANLTPATTQATNSSPSPIPLSSAPSQSQRSASSSTQHAAHFRWQHDLIHRNTATLTNVEVDTSKQFVQWMQNHQLWGCDPPKNAPWNVLALIKLYAFTVDYKIVNLRESVYSCLSTFVGVSSGHDQTYIAKASGIRVFSPEEVSLIYGSISDLAGLRELVRLAFPLSSLSDDPERFLEYPKEFLVDAIMFSRENADCGKKDKKRYVYFYTDGDDGASSVTMREDD